jgi:hypothetical protein
VWLHPPIAHVLCRGAPTAETFRAAGSRVCTDLPGSICVARFWTAAKVLPRHLVLTDAEADSEVAVYDEHTGTLLVCQHGSCTSD